MKKLLSAFCALSALSLTAFAEPAAQPAAPTGFMAYLPTIIYFGVIIFVFYFLLIRPQKKREKETKEMLASLKVGDKVASIGGIIGEIVKIKDDTVTIETGADKVKIKLERAAIRGITNIK